MPPSPPTVHVVDDDEEMRASLVLLARSCGYEAVGYPDAETLLDSGVAPMPCCVVTDLLMPGMTGTELIGRLRRAERPVPVVVVTGHGSVKLAVAAMRAGASDFVEKPFAPDTVMDAIRNALGEIDDVMRDAAMGAQRRLATLTRRERDVLAGLLAGKINKAIGHELGISHRTVEVYRAHIMAKAGASSVSELVRLAFAAGVG